ncbi:MAG: CHAT domain-containing tetratricopeptide repeat protein [Planctomycetota bacterium]
MVAFSLPLLLCLSTAQTTTVPTSSTESRGLLHAFEVQRVELSNRLSEGRVDGALGDARRLLEGAEGEPESPEWYRAEIRGLVDALETLDALEPEDREVVVATLAARPDPRVDAESAAEDLESHAALLAEVFGEGHPLVAERYFFLSNISSQTGRLDDALGYAQEAVACAELLEGDRDAQVALRRMWLGWIHRRRTEVPEAEAELLWSLDALERLDARRLGVFVEPRLHATNYLGLLYLDTYRHDDAEPLLRTYVEESREALGSNSRPHLGGLNNLAVFLHSRERSSEAVAIQTECLARGLEVLGEDSHEVAQIWFNLGGYCTAAGRLLEARAAYERALEILDPLPLHAEVAALSRARLGRVMWKLGDVERALDLVDAAASEITTTTGDLPSEQRMLVGEIASSLSAQGRYERAKAFLDEHESLVAADAVWSLNLRLSRAIVEARSGETDTAHEALARIVPELQRELPGENRNVSVGLSTLARTHERRGDLERARELLLESIESYDRLRSSVALGFGRSLLLETSPYEQLAGVELARGRIEEAWRVLETDRSRSLHELLSSARAPDVRVPLERELANMEAQLEVLESSSAEPAGDDVQERTLELTKRILALRGRLALEEIGQVESPRALHDVRASLAYAEAAVGWFQTEDLGERRTYAWLLRHEGPPAWRLVETSRSADGPAPSERVRALAEDFAAEAQSVFAPRVESIVGRADDLGGALFGALAGDGLLDGVEHLVVVAAGFEGVPFEALRVDGQWIGDRFTVSYAPSCTIHTLLRERARSLSSSGAALVLGDPPFRPSHVGAATDEETGKTGAALRSSSSLADLDRIPRTRDEALAVAASFEDSTVLTGVDASEPALDRLAEDDALARYSIVHFATHALVDDVVPRRSGIALSQVGLPDPFEAAMRGRRPDDGFLTVAEIASRWRLEANLVTLSGCRSALGRSIRGEGHVGLTTAFLQAGAQSVLASLWDVQDEPTMLFMRSFYRHWTAESRIDGATRERAKVEALRRARRDVREHEVDGVRPYAHPAFWAAFVLIGAPD